MSQTMLRSPFLMFMISISFFGLFLVVTVAFNQPMIQENFHWRKPAIGLVFGSICVMGIVAVFFPNQCSRIYGLRKEKENTRSHASYLPSHGGSPTLQAHHPKCRHFSAHVVRIEGRPLCAACTGLLLGALVALAGTALYFFTDCSFSNGSFLAVSVGALAVGLGLFQLRFRNFVRLFLNTSFVLGAFLILVGIDALTQSVLVDLFLVVLTVFWLLTRILLSDWDHRRICYACESPCEILEQKKRG